MENILKPKFKLKNNVSESSAASSVNQKAAQDWLPMSDLHDGLLYRPDGAVIGGVAVSPFSLALKSINETRSIIEALHTAINGLDQPWEILSMYRPVDLDAYLVSLDSLLRKKDLRRKAVLRDYLSWVTSIVLKGENVERRYYLLIVRTGREAAFDHRTHLSALVQDLQRARGLQVKVMTDQDWRELLFLTFQAGHAASEAVPDGLSRIPPILSVGG